MLKFIAGNWIIFVIIAGVLLLGLFGYIIDRKKFEDYKNEILKGTNGDASSSISNIDDVANVEKTETK